MKKPKFSLNYKDDTLLGLVQQTDHKTLGIWAKGCADRVLHYFEESYPQDLRPEQALKTLQYWIDSGSFRMADIRGASFSAHAAAREVGKDSPARSAARTAGQAVATAHVPGHSIAAANYALQTVHRAARAEEAELTVTQERAWHHQYLLELQKK